VGWGRWQEKGRRMNILQIMYPYVCNAKMIPLKTVPGIRGGGMTESSAGSEFKYDKFDTL
jgi:hypothetical protein